jgi:hypothetical protein
MAAGSFLRLGSLGVTSFPFLLFADLRSWALRDLDKPLLLLLANVR